MSGRGLGHTGGTLDKLESIPGYRRRADDRRVHRAGARDRRRDHRPEREPRAGRQAALCAARRDRDRRQRLADRGEHHVEEAGRRRRRDRPRRQGRRRRVHEDARRRARPGRDDDRARASGPGARSSACSPTWTSRSARRSATRSRSARRSTRSEARGRRTSRSSCSRRSRICSRSPISASTRSRGASAPRRRSPTAPRSRPTSGGSARRAAIPIAARCPRPPVVREVTAPSAGFVRRLGAIQIGHAALHLGAGRRTKEDSIDYSVGVVCRAKRGDEVAERRRARRDTRARRGVRGRGGGRGARRLRARGRAAAAAPDRPRHPLPELPEVETERGRLAARIEGRRIAEARIDDARLTRPEDPAIVAAILTGERVEAVERRGKYIVVRLESGQVLLVHLRMTGGFRYEPATHERAVLELDDGTRIAYRDLRRFGTWLLLELGGGRSASRGRLGPEPLGRGFTAAFLAERLAGRQGAGEGGDPRPADGRGPREHLRGRGALVRGHPSAATCGRAGRRRGRRATGRDSQGPASRHPPPGRRSRRRRLRRRADAARIQGVRAPGRAVRPLRHADREDPGRRARHLVLPGLPARHPSSE